MSPKQAQGDGPSRRTALECQRGSTGEGSSEIPGSDQEMAKRKRKRITENITTLVVDQDTSTRLWLEAAIEPVTTDEEAFTGKEWEVTIIGPKGADDLVTIEGEQFIRSKNGRLYSVKSLAESANLFEGAKVYDDHLTQAEFDQRQGMRSPNKEWLGTIVKPFWDGAAKAIKGFFRVVEDRLAAKLKNAWEAGVLNTIGLSIDTYPIVTREARIEGQRFPIIEGFKKILSVDLVAEPAAGGSLDRIVASQTNSNGETDMDREELQELIGGAVSNALSTVVPDLVRSTLAEALDDEAEEDDAQETEAEAEAAEGDEEPEAVTEEPETQTAAVNEAVRLVECRQILFEAIIEAKLKPNGAKLVKEAFGGRIFDEKKLKAFIKTVKESEAAGDPTGRVSENGNGRGQQITMGLDEKQRFELELTRLLMGNRKFDRLEENYQDPLLKDRVSEAYQDWVNSGKSAIKSYHRPSVLVSEFMGGNPLFMDLKVEEASTLASVIKNAMNVMIANDYSMQHRWYEPLVTTEEVDTIDQATLVRTFGLDTLDVVNKGDAYTEAVQEDEEETATFVKRGNFVGVPIEDLMQDKIAYFRTLPRRLANTWYNTLSSLTAAVFTVNSSAGPVLTDSGALFNATAVGTTGGHANLLTAALSYTNFSSARTAMRKQTDQPLGGGEKLQISPRFLLVPEDLETTANTIRNSEQIPGSANNDMNQFFQKFEVIPVPNWTDANDWALVGDPEMFPAIWHIFPRGGNMPMLFTADSELVGAMFTNDTIRYKIRMFTWRFSATYDCMPVSDWRPLHKNNVT